MAVHPRTIVFIGASTEKGRNMSASEKTTGQVPVTQTSGRQTEQLWTIQEVARYLRVSMATVRRWTRTGLLPSYRPGGRYGRRLFSEAHVREFLIRGQQATEPTR